MSDRIAVMSEGRVEQIASPTEIYAEPATVFVAGFIGQANLWRARIESFAGDTAIVEALGGRTHATEGGDDEVSGFVAGVEATLMVRPERVRVAVTDPGDGAVRATVTDLTFQGPVVRLAAEAIDGSAIVAHVGPEAELPLLRPGDQVWVGWDATAARVLPGSPDEAVDPDLEDA